MDTESDFRAMVEGAYNEAEAATPVAPNVGNGDGVATPDGGGVVETAPDSSASDGDAGLPGAETSAAREARARDATGKFLPKGSQTKAPEAGKEVSTRPPGGAGEKGASPLVVAPPTGAEPPASPPTLKAPQGWTPAEREHFAKAPMEVQQAIARRETEITRGLQEAAPARKHYEAYQAAMAPFLPMLQAQGRDPLQEATGLLQTAFRLQNGSPQERAAIMANIYKAYPVPVEMFAQAIDGTGAPQQGAQTVMSPEAIAQQAEERVMQRIQRQSIQRSQQEGQQAVNEFLATEPEFMGDVREDMSDRMVSAARGGRALTLQQAYDSACWANPEVRAILQGRAKAEAAKANTATMQQAKVAASSVKSTPSTNASTVSKVSTANSYRDIVSAAYDSLDGR